ncbi:MAG: hypothetical protein V4619_15505 [Bacteroidota bacterium]
MGNFFVMCHLLIVLGGMVALFLWYLVRRVCKYRGQLPELKPKRFRLYKKKIITRADGAAYLVRYSVFSCRWFAVKVHNILLSDPACPHDHPWSFISLIMRGGYVEHTPTGSKVFGAGSLLYRPADYVHRLEVHQPVWTLVVTFKKTRPWGFYTKNGWVHWRAYNPQNTCE